MWSKLTVADTARMQKYRACYRHQSGRERNLAALRSEIKRSGKEFYLYEGVGFELMLCLGLKRRSGRHIIFEESYTASIVPAVVVPLVVDKVREYVEEHGTNAVYAFMSENVPPEGIELFRLIGQTPGVTVTQSPSPPNFIDVKVEFDLTPVPP